MTTLQIGTVRLVVGKEGLVRTELLVDDSAGGAPPVGETHVILQPYRDDRGRYVAQLDVVGGHAVLTRLELAALIMHMDAIERSA